MSEDKGAAKMLIELATELQEGAGVLEALTRGTATLCSDDSGDLLPATTYAAALSEWGALHAGPHLTSTSSTSSPYLYLLYLLYLLYFFLLTLLPLLPVY